MARRKTDPRAAAHLADDEDAATAYRRFLAAADQVMRELDRVGTFPLQWPLERKVWTRALGSPLPTAVAFGGPVFPTSHSAELALALGELSRIAALPPAALATEVLGTRDLTAATRQRLGAENDLGALYPLLCLVSDVILRHRRPPVPAGEEGLAQTTVRTALVQLQQLHERLTAPDRPLTRSQRHLAVAPLLGARLGSAAFLGVSHLPEAFELAYAETWHTAPKTKSVTGGFVATVRDRAAQEGAPALLVVLAASSDGRNRQVAGRSSRTPLPVYDKLIWDNSLGVLDEVVQNAHFTNARAEAMRATDLPLQLVAIMRRAHAVDMRIRILAAERCITHERVDPNYVFDFLTETLGHPALTTPAAEADGTPPRVWDALWHKLLMEMRSRLLLARTAVAEGRGDEGVVRTVEQQTRRFAKRFVDTILAEYAAQQRQLRHHDRYVRQAAAAHVESRAFLRDADLLALLIDGELHDERRLLKLMELCVQAGIGEELLAAALAHDDPTVHAQGQAAVPHPDEARVVAATAHVRGQMTRRLALVRETVFRDVIPNYVAIPGEPRALSRMHHHFEAAKEVPEAELVATFVACAERDPRTIPDEFRRITAAYRYAARVAATTEAALIEDADPDDAMAREVADPAPPAPGAPETICRPAIRTPDGRVVEGTYHADAVARAGLDIEGDWVGGFTTSTGRFVETEEAYAIAEAADQMRPDARALHEATGARYLDTTDLRARPTIPTPGDEPFASPRAAEARATAAPVRAASARARLSEPEGGDPAAQTAADARFFQARMAQADLFGGGAESGMVQTPPTPPPSRSRRRGG